MRETLKRKVSKSIYLMYTKPRVSTHLAIAHLIRLNRILTQDHFDARRTLLLRQSYMFLLHESKILYIKPTLMF